MGESKRRGSYADRIAPADVLGWRPLPRAVVEDGRVVGVVHG